MKHDCYLVQVWHFLFVFSCLTSGYFYGWCALFGVEDDDHDYKVAIYIYETIFSIRIIINFLTEYIPEGDVIPVRNLTAISQLYLNTTFWRDFIPTFPITFFLNTRKESTWRVLYLIKIMRLAIGLEIFNV